MGHMKMLGLAAIAAAALSAVVSETTGTLFTYRNDQEDGRDSGEQVGPTRLWTRAGDAMTPVGDQFGKVTINTVIGNWDNGRNLGDEIGERDKSLT
jgi:hypothetical protein